MANPVDLSNRVALIMGGSRGIGAAAAAVFARAGARVAIAARSVDKCRSVAQAIADAGGEAEAFGCDVSDPVAVERTVTAVADRFGGIDVVVNNAGVIEPIGRIGEVDPAKWAQNITINLIGAFNAIRYSMPYLLQSAGGGVLLNVSSGAADKPYEGWSAYCAGKAGLAMLTRSVAMETAGSGLRAIGIRPGVVDTEMQVNIRASGVNPVSGLPRETLLPPEAPAELMLWLCGPDADDAHGREVDIRDPDIQKRAGIRIG